MDRIKVCHISTAHYLYDTRIFYKECISLSEAGYDVSYVVTNERDQDIKGIHIVALPTVNGRLKRFIISPFRALRKALRTKSKIYHFHDPDLIFIGVILKLLGKKVIFDIHELVYYQIEDKEWLRNKFLKYVAQKIYLLFEKIAVKLFDGLVIADENGYMPHFNERYAKYMNKISLVRNFSIINYIDLFEKDNYQYDRPLIIYAGGLCKARGIFEVIKATELLKNNVFFLIFGRWDEDYYRKQCEKTVGWQNVIYKGFQKPELVYSNMKNADIGISLLYPIKNYITSMPVKAFEYMACNLPIVMSDFPLWRELFKDCAYFANPYKPEDIAEKIDQLLDDPEKRKGLETNGRKLVEEKYSWEAEKHNLLNLYKRIINK